MSHNDDEQALAAMAELAYPDALAPEGDFYLRWLVASVNLRPEAELEITLSMSGAIYTGTMISRKRFAEINRRLVGAMGMPDGLAAFYQEPFDALLQVERDEAPDTSTEFDMMQEIDRATHIHLAGFTVYQGREFTFAAGEDATWRGLTDKVDGWSLAPAV